jgi:hypothetical protein
MVTVTYKYKRATVKMSPITEIIVNGEKVGYYLPLYNKPEYRFTPKQNRWYVNINNGNYFLIEKMETKKGIVIAIENYFKRIEKAKKYFNFA